MNVMSTEPCSPPQFFGVAVARVGTTLTPTEVAAAKCKMVFLQLGSWTMFAIIFCLNWLESSCLSRDCDDAYDCWCWWWWLLMMEDSTIMASIWTVCLSILDGHCRMFLHCCNNKKKCADMKCVQHISCSKTWYICFFFWSFRIRTRNKFMKQWPMRPCAEKCRHLKQLAGGGAIHFSRGQGLLGRRWRRGGKISGFEERCVSWTLSLSHL